MVSTSQPAPAQPAMAQPTAASERAVARLNARVSGYLIDSAFLLVFILAFFVIGGGALLFTSDLGADDPPDSAYYAFAAVAIGGTIVAWSMFNIALAAWRGQSAGMYIIGIRISSEQGGGISLRRSLLRWLAFHPLLFHPLLLPLWAGLSYLATALTLNQGVFALSLGLVFLCLAAPVAGVVAVLIDPDRRALHDRLAGTVVVHLD